MRPSLFPTWLIRSSGSITSLDIATHSGFHFQSLRRPNWPWIQRVLFPWRIASPHRMTGPNFILWDPPIIFRSHAGNRHDSSSGWSPSPNFWNFTAHKTCPPCKIDMPTTSRSACGCQHLSHHLPVAPIPVPKGSNTQNGPKYHRDVSWQHCQLGVPNDLIFGQFWHKFLSKTSDHLGTEPNFNGPDPWRGSQSSFCPKQYHWPAGLITSQSIILELNNCWACHRLGTTAYSWLWYSIGSKAVTRYPCLS